MIPVGRFAITTEDIYTLDRCLQKGSRVKITYVNHNNDTYDIEDEDGRPIYSVWACSLTEEQGIDVKLRLIPNWHERNLICHFCGETRSVKYSMQVYNPIASNNVTEVCVCNKCALLNIK